MKKRVIIHDKVLPRALCTRSLLSSFHRSPLLVSPHARNAHLCGAQAHTHTLESEARAEDVRRHSALIARRRRRHCRRRSRRSVLLELKLLLVLLGDDRDV